MYILLSVQIFYVKCEKYEERDGIHLEGIDSKLINGLKTDGKEICEKFERHIHILCTYYVSTRLRVNEAISYL